MGVGLVWYKCWVSVVFGLVWLSVGLVWYKCLVSVVV